MIFGAAVKAREALPNGAPRRRRPKAGESGKRTRRPNAWAKGEFSQLNCGLVRESSQNPLNSGLGIILICPELMVNCWFGLVAWDSRGTPK